MTVGDVARIMDPIGRAALEASARVERTRCGEGTMVWRRWGTGRPLVLLHVSPPTRSTP